MGSFYMEATQINYRRDGTFKTVDQKLQELSETSAIDTDIAPVFKSANTYHPGDMVYYRNKLYVFNVEHTGAWAAADVTATDVTTELSSLKSGLTNYENQNNLNLEVPNRKNIFDKDNMDVALKYYDGGRWISSTSDGFTTVFVPVNSGVTYTASGFPELTGAASVFTTNDKSTVVGAFTSDHNNGAHTVPQTAVYIGFAISNLPEQDMSSAQLEKGSTATAYAPYIPSVESRIEAVESGLADNDRNYTLTASTGTEIVNSSIVVNHKSVNISLICSVTATTQTWADIGTIDKKPSDKITIPVVKTSNGNYVGMVEISSAGLIRLYATQDLTSNSIAFSAAYKTNV